MRTVPSHIAPFVAMSLFNNSWPILPYRREHQKHEHRYIPITLLPSKLPQPDYQDTWRPQSLPWCTCEDFSTWVTASCRSGGCLMALHLHLRIDIDIDASTSCFKPDATFRRRSQLLRANNHSHIGCAVTPQPKVARSDARLFSCTYPCMSWLH